MHDEPRPGTAEERLWSVIWRVVLPGMVEYYVQSKEQD